MCLYARLLLPLVRAMQILDTSLTFKTRRFDTRTELPADANAGNRFYGQDLATYLCERFGDKGWLADFLDEDWGWLVAVDIDSATRFEVAIYLLGAPSEGLEPEWGLWIRAFQRKRRFGFLPVRSSPVSGTDVEAAVRDAIHLLGAMPGPWDGSI